MRAGPARKWYWIDVLVGALLTGFAWRVRGTGGWGAAWGLLTVGMLLLLFLTAALGRRCGPDLPLIALASFSFMLTAPAWGTLLKLVTGVMTVEYAAGEETVYVSPVSGVILMLCMGFGLAAVFGVLLGRCFGKTAWRKRDYFTVALVFFLVAYGAKACVAHLLVRLVQPEAVEAFARGLAVAGSEAGPFAAYLSHFNSESWAKTIAGGRHYYACVSAFSSALASGAAILTTRFFVRDRYAARIGLTVCAAFAVSITASDLFFWYDCGGYRMLGGFSLPEGFAAWSLWEYFTGFFAGGAISAVVLHTAPAEETPEALLARIPQKPRTALLYLLCWVGLIGANVVRPLLRRLKDSPAQIPACIGAGLAVLAVSLLLACPCGLTLDKVSVRRLAPALCGAFTLYIMLVYMFVSAGEPAYRSIADAHNILVCVSFAAVAARCAALLTRAVRSERKG